LPSSFRSCQALTFYPALAYGLDNNRIRRVNFIGARYRGLSGVVYRIKFACGRSKQIRHNTWGTGLGKIADLKFHGSKIEPQTPMSNGKRNEQSQSVSQYSLQHCVRVYQARFSAAQPKRRRQTVEAPYMPLSEYDSKEALRVAADWLTASELPGSAAALEGIADTIPLVMMGMVELNDLDDLAAIVEKHGRAVHDAATPEDVQRAQLKEAVKAAFDHVRPVRRDAVR
jgi:hypothetical protein